MRRPSGHRPRPRYLLAVAIAACAAVVLPGVAAAHPLGNFTINHYAGITVTPDRVILDVVIDQAEIPAFQTRLTIDVDGDGNRGDRRLDARWRDPASEGRVRASPRPSRGGAAYLTATSVGGAVKT